MASTVAKTSVLVAANKLLLLGEALESNKLILEKYYAHATFSQALAIILTKRPEFQNFISQFMHGGVI